MDLLISDFKAQRRRSNKLADRATRHTANTHCFHVPSRPEVIALHLQSWLAFFSESSRSGATPHTPAVIRGRLLGQPNLLGPEVEKLVGNLYEMGILLQAQV